MIKYSTQESIDIIYGSNMKASVKAFPNVEYSDKDEVVNLLKKKGLYEKYSMLCTVRLNSSVFKKEIDAEILTLVKLVKSYRVSLSKRK